LSHNGIQIDQFILLTIYPCAVFFGIGFLAKRTGMKESIKYFIQAVTCMVFSAAYFIAIPHGGAQGLAIVLALFGILLIIMARRYTILPEDKEKEKEKKEI